MSSVIVSGPGLIQGAFIPPGDKSISHRAVMFGALSDGESSYTHFLEAEDCLSTLEAFRAMGVSID
ncbi:MAG: 3-phosphoshikimate 1-carboxyvinyltransferase, partial [Candidatus Omnitrophica bacterium]|nr:3-phosphoshikimate 1-carboxyvinyltransferase [Candidatus Omnitrophota bacterium]